MDRARDEWHGETCAGRVDWCAVFVLSDIEK